ncbi:hypothetical protein CONCODRAFT_9431, partial [Conidiobolus coronatus NRRL 28638]
AKEYNKDLESSKLVEPLPDCDDYKLKIRQKHRKQTIFYKCTSTVICNYIGRNSKDFGFNVCEQVIDRSVENKLSPKDTYVLLTESGCDEEAFTLKIMYSIDQYY